MTYNVFGGTLNPTLLHHFHGCKAPLSFVKQRYTKCQGFTFYFFIPHALHIQSFKFRPFVRLEKSCAEKSGYY